MYESDVVNFGGSEGDAAGLVPIYPFEGTFMATHPACLNSAADDESQEAARQFREYLLPVKWDSRAQRQTGCARSVWGRRRPSSFNKPGASSSTNLKSCLTLFVRVDTVYAVQDLLAGSTQGCEPGDAHRRVGQYARRPDRRRAPGCKPIRGADGR